MNETGRVTSTARKISRSWLWRLAGIFFWLNLVLLALTLLCFCYAQESAALGSAWTPELSRSFLLPDFSRDEGFWQTLANALDALSRAEYIFFSPEGQLFSVDLGHFLLLLKPFALMLLVFEALIFLGQLFSGPRRARRLLEPLDRMARAARELGRNARYAKAPANGEKLHDLENAISRISPDQPEQKLDMGDQDLKGLQDAINSLLGRMHESYRQQAQFVSDASHELRTPIAVIQGYANMLERWGKQDEKILDESIAAIKSEAAYMNRLIEQLLFLARGDTGRNAVELKALDLGELMREVGEDCRLIDAQHDWRIEARDGVICTGDRDMLKQCARILADNAVKYTPEGGVIRLRAFTDAEGQPCFEVQDSGIGMSAADAPHVFDRFYRSDPARTRQSGGTGLGLAIARWIVERHGGHIDLLSREGVGTRMTVCLPKSE